MGKMKPPKLPVEGKRNILITSALPYVNNVPHLGNIIGCVLSADVFARYCRLRGYNAIYICGTDEYGTSTEVKALCEKCSPREICDKYHRIHKEVYDWFDISFDEFGRTSTPEQTELCQEIFKKLLDNKFLFENAMQQLYCNQCKMFLADSFAVGTCPFPDCGYEQSKGDQCDKCGKMLDAVELKNPKCKTCQTTPSVRDTKHFFIDLPSLCEKLENYIGKALSAGCWSRHAVDNTRGLLRGGLKPRCITRDLKWGVPVPLDDYSDKVLYVWFDAPIGYISITKSYTPEWEKWWKNPENVELYQFMGKDNVQFHTVMFPSMLLGTGESWTMAKTISATQFLMYETGKFSKSQGLGIFGDQAKETTIPVAVWRYYLLSNRPEGSDARFSWDDLQAKLNGELIANVGNFVNRVLTFIAKPSGKGYGSIIPDVTRAESDDLTRTLGHKIGEYVDHYFKEMEKVNLKSGLRIAMQISSEGNSYLQESKFWRLYKEERPRCSIIVKTAVGLVYLLACLLEPFMPSFSAEVMKQLDLPPSEISLPDVDKEMGIKLWEIVPPGHKIGEPKPLFVELTDKEVEVYKMKFGGVQNM